MTTVYGPAAQPLISNDLLVGVFIGAALTVLFLLLIEWNR